MVYRIEILNQVISATFTSSVMTHVVYNSAAQEYKTLPAIPSTSSTPGKEPYGRLASNGRRVHCPSSLPRTFKVDHRRLTRASHG